MKIAIVDDDRQLHDRLKAYLDDLLAGSYEWLYYPSGEAFLSEWAPGMCDLVILDIFMGGLTGMEVAREMRRADREVKIVFCTTSNEFASESYEVNACYYLHKPLEKEQVKAMLDRVDLAQLERARTVQLPDGTAAVLRDIIYADCAAHYVTLHCRHGKSVRVRASLGDLERLLCAYPYFFCPSKGLIVNLYEVAAQGTDAFRMSDGSPIPISRRKAKEATEVYSSFLFDQLRKGGGK